LLVTFFIKRWWKKLFLINSTLYSLVFKQFSSQKKNQVACLISKWSGWKSKQSLLILCFNTFFHYLITLLLFILSLSLFSFGHCLISIINQPQAIRIIYKDGFPYLLIKIFWTIWRNRRVDKWKTSGKLPRKMPQNHQLFSLNIYLFLLF